MPEDPWLPAVKPAAWLERYAVFRPAFDKGRFVELSREFTLDESKLLTKYSYGQRKKFALAAALASGARLILLDEPTNGLDIPSKSQFRRALAASVDSDRVVVVSTHQVRDLERVNRSGGNRPRRENPLLPRRRTDVRKVGREARVRDLGPEVIYAEKRREPAIRRSLIFRAVMSRLSMPGPPILNSCSTLRSPLRSVSKPALRGERLSAFDPAYAAEGETVGKEAVK